MSHSESPEHTITALCQRSHDISKEKGWLDNPRPFSAIASLIHSEISEALEDYRSNRGLNEYYYECKTENGQVVTRHSKESIPSLELEVGKVKEVKPAGIPVELADVIIRVCQWIGTQGFTAEFARLLEEQERETKWFERYLKDFEAFSAMAHARTSKAYLAWDGCFPEPEHSDSLAIKPLVDLTHLVFAFCRVHEIDLWAAIDEKEAFNRTRPHKHGGKKNLMAKPILLLDCDGVLANFVDATLSILNDEFGVKNYTHDDVKTWEMFSSFPDHKHLRDDVYEILKKKGGCYGIPPYPGAQNGVSALKELVDIVIVTSPFNGSETWVHERERWLEMLFDISHKKVIHTGLKELIDGDIFVDDKVEHVVKWAKAHPSKHAILWAQRYNEGGDHEGLPNIVRISGWSELLISVRELTSSVLGPRDAEGP